MLSRVATFFKKPILNQIQHRNYISEMHKISTICDAIEEGKIPEAKHLIAKFATESGCAHFNMLDMVIESATKCQQHTLVNEIKQIKHELGEEATQGAANFNANNL